MCEMTQEELEELARSMIGKPVLDDSGRKIGKITASNWNPSSGIVYKMLFDKKGPMGKSCSCVWKVCKK